NMLKICMEKRHRRDAHEPDEPPGNDAVIVQSRKEPACEEDTPDRPDENHDACDLVADRVRFRRHRQVRSHELAPASCRRFISVVPPGSRASDQNTILFKKYIQISITVMTDPAHSRARLVHPLVLLADRFERLAADDLRKAVLLREDPGSE